VIFLALHAILTASPSPRANAGSPPRELRRCARAFVLDGTCLPHAPGPPSDRVALDGSPVRWQRWPHYGRWRAITPTLLVYIARCSWLVHEPAFLSVFSCGLPRVLTPSPLSVKSMQPQSLLLTQAALVGTSRCGVRAVSAARRPYHPESLIVSDDRGKDSKSTSTRGMRAENILSACRIQESNRLERQRSGNHERDLMKRMKYFGIIATCLVAFSVLMAQTKPSNPSVPGNNPPRVPGNNPSLPGSNPPRVPGNTNPSLPNGNIPSVPGSTAVPGISPIGSPAANAIPSITPISTATPR